MSERRNQPNQTGSTEHVPSETTSMWGIEFNERREGRTAVIVAPNPPMASTQQALEAARSFDPGMNIIAVTPETPEMRDRPVPIFNEIDQLRQELPPPKNGRILHSLVEHILREYGVDPALSATLQVDGVIFAPDNNAVDLVADQVQEWRGTVDGILPNLTAWNQPFVASLAQELKTRGSDNLRYPSPEAVGLGRDKYKFNRFQESMGLRVPYEILCLPNGNEENDIADILKAARQTYSSTGKMSMLKFVDGTGSSGVTQLDPRLSEDVQYGIVRDHVQRRYEGEVSASTVQEYMSGVEAGMHIEVFDGKVTVHYTRKKMARGSEGRNSEEISHSIDPDDPFHELCERILTPKIKRIISEAGVKDGFINGDGMLDLVYFDSDGRAITKEPAGSDDSFIIEMDFGRIGGTGIQKMLGRVYKNDFEMLCAGLSVGDRRSAQRLRGLKHKKARNAALLEVAFSDYAGYVLDPPTSPEVGSHVDFEYKNKIGASILPKTAYANAQDNIFYTSMRDRSQLPGYRPPVEGDYLARVTDWKTKGARPVVGVSGETAQKRDENRLSVLGNLGMTLLSAEGLVWFSQKEGGYVETPVEEGSAVGRHLNSRGYFKGNAGWTKET